MGAYVKSDSSRGRRGEGSPGLRCSGAVIATVNWETVSVGGWGVCLFLKGDGLTQCVHKYPCWGWGPLTEQLRHYIWTNSPSTLTAYSFLVTVEVWVYVWESDKERQHAPQGLSLPSVTSGLLLYPVFCQSPSHCSPPSIHLIFLSSLPASALGLSGHIIWHLVGTFYPECLTEVEAHTFFCGHLINQSSKPGCHHSCCKTFTF